MSGYSAIQIEAAKTVFQFWKSKGCTDIQAAAWCGDIDGECSFDPRAVGDRDAAFGIAQDHAARIASIEAGTGIDMKTAGLADQLAGIFWEVTAGPYRKVFPALRATTTLAGAITVLVARFEQSGSQARDVARRTALAQHWLDMFGAKP